MYNREISFRKIKMASSIRKYNSRKNLAWLHAYFRHLLIANRLNTAFPMIILVLQNVFWSTYLNRCTISEVHWQQYIEEGVARGGTCDTYRT